MTKAPRQRYALPAARRAAWRLPFPVSPRPGAAPGRYHEARGLRGGGAGAAAMEVQVAPLRSWEDFFPGSDRFGRPDFKDISKWNNRVVNNLLYYQTNYLMVAAAVVAIVGSVRGEGVGGSGGGAAGWGAPRPPSVAIFPNAEPPSLWGGGCLA